MSIVAILTYSCFVYAGVCVLPSFSLVSEEHTQNTLGLLTLVLEGIMVMGAFSGIVFNLTFASLLLVEYDTMVVLDRCCRWIG